MFHVPEKYRLIQHPLLASSEKDGNNGMFVIPHYRINDYEIRIMCSDGEGWEHVSVTIAQKRRVAKRNPNWEEMCWVKDLLWDTEDCVIQYHPPQSDYISNHPFCLHLWRPIGYSIPMPPSIMVGLKELNNLSDEYQAVHPAQK